MRIGVIGAGVVGLAVARRLAQSGIASVVLEAAPYAVSGYDDGEGGGGRCIPNAETVAAVLLAVAVTVHVGVVSAVKHCSATV